MLLFGMIINWWLMIDDVYFSDGPFYFISIPRRDRPNKVIISPLILTHSSGNWCVSCVRGMIFYSFCWCLLLMAFVELFWFCVDETGKENQGNLRQQRRSRDTKLIAMMIMMYGISLFLVLIILGPPPSSLVVSSFSILYSFPNSSLWRDRYYDPTTQNPSKTKTRGGNNNNKQTRDYYQVLGVGKTAKNPEIKAAFHRLVKLYHPGTYRHYRSFSRDIEPPTTKRHHRTTHIEFWKKQNNPLWI